MAWTLCTSGSAILKAGSHANSTIIASGSALADWSAQSEGWLCAITNTDWVSNYSSLLTPIKNVISDIVSSHLGQKIVAYDTTGFIAREADMLMNFNDEVIQRGLAVLNKKANTLQTP